LAHLAHLAPKSLPEKFRGAVLAEAIPVWTRPRAQGGPEDRL